MRLSVPSLLSAAGLALGLTQECTGGAVDEGGNWYCGAVRHILYEGLGGKGSFRTVTNMGDDGRCEMEDRPYSGPLAPLDEDLSLHFRGPIFLKEMAVYYPTPSPKQSRNKRRSPHSHARSSSRAHQRLRALHLKKKGARVARRAAGTPVPYSLSWPTEATLEQAPKAPTNGRSHAKAPPKQTPSPSHNGDWDRVAYYNAEQQVADNVMFLGNYGGQESGVWDETWGNSLAFLNSSGTGSASSPQILEDVFIPSNKEFAIFSAEKCDGSCGFSRDQQTAYKGFTGANKVFLFTFRMPLDGDRGFNGDMPALWALNGRIPRSAQYSSCNCWASGCGEVDIFEVLERGGVKCKSTFHLASGAGSLDWFERPVDEFIKVATVFDERRGSVSIRVLSDDVDFSELLSAQTVEAWVTGGDDSPGNSMYQVS